MDYCQLNQRAAPVAPVVLDVVPLLAQINTDSSTRYADSTTANTFFLSLSQKESKAVCTDTAQKQYIFTVLPWGLVNLPSLCHNRVQRDLNHLYIPQDITLV
jgi:hypothetical protein